MAISTTTQLTAPVNVIFQQRLLRVAKARCAHFLGSMPGTVSSHAGTFTVTYRRHDALTPTTTALTELSGNLSLPTRAGTALAITDVSATISKYGAHVFLTEEADLINFNGQTDAIVQTLAIQAGRSLNRLQRNVLEDNATLVYASGAAADANVADAIDADLIESATNTLETNSSLMFLEMTTGSTNVGTNPILPAYYGICHTHIKADIRKLANFISVEKYAGQVNILPGEFGSTGDVRWVASPEASADTDTGGAPGTSLRSTSGSNADLYTSMVLGMEAFGSVSLDTGLIQEVYNAGDDVPGIMVISKPKGSAGVGDPLDEVASMGWKAWHTGVQLNSNFSRGLRTASAKLT